MKIQNWLTIFRKENNKTIKFNKKPKIKPFKFKIKFKLNIPCKIMMKMNN